MLKYYLSVSSQASLSCCREGTSDSLYVDMFYPDFSEIIITSYIAAEIFTWLSFDLNGNSIN